MKRSFLDSVLRGAEALAARDPVGTLPDPELLRRFAAGRDPAAFAMLVRRHGPLVWGVCRNLLPADADAEDAFQATFLALIRSAASIRRTEALGGWLHGVAYRVALKARRSAARRKKREVIAAVPEPSSPVPDAAWDELQAVVHEEVCKLPDKLRLPFVLCGLQGRPQKEAAEVLGWKVGTVSGRLSEARRQLLERLARRGMPVGVAVGAAVLGGVAGWAAVPPTISVKVLSAAATPAAVSQTVLSLARGVTPMYLTRTKLLAAGIVLAGILTTGLGALSRADAQGQPPDKSAEAVKKALDYLQFHQASRSQWEYKFIPIEKPLTTADLQRVLAGADHEGWNYCGSQELAESKTGKVTPHMVFKRPRAGALAGDPGAAAGLLELAARQQEAAALAESLQAAERAARKQELGLKVEPFGLQGQIDEAKRRKAFEQQMEEFSRAAKWADEKAHAEHNARDVEKLRAKELEDLKAKYESVIQQLQAELKAKSAQSTTSSGTSATDPFKGQPVTSIIKLQYVKGNAAAEILAKVMPEAKIVAEISPSTITVKGPAELIMKAREIILKLDVAPAGTSTTATDDKEFVIKIFPLRHAKAEDMAKVLTKALPKGRFTYDAATNMLVAAAPPNVLMDVAKLITELDAGKGPGN